MDYRNHRDRNVRKEQQKKIIVLFPVDLYRPFYNRKPSMDPVLGDFSKALFFYYNNTIFFHLKVHRYTQQDTNVGLVRTEKRVLNN